MVRQLTTDALTATGSTSTTACRPRVWSTPRRRRRRAPSACDDLGARAAEAEHQLARLDDPAPVAPVNDARSAGTVERDARRSPDRKRHPRVRDQPLHGPHGRGHRVVQVQLHDLDAVAVAGVADVDRHGDRRRRSPARRPSDAASDHSNVRVAESVPEREGRRRVDVRHLVAPRELAARGRSTAARRGRAGTLTGRRPLGFTRPLSTPAIAPVPSSPAKNVCTIAAASSGAEPSAYGRPASSVTHGRRARSRARRRAAPAGHPGGVRSAASQPSPLVPRPNRPARSPSASTTTSARMPRPRPRRIRRSRRRRPSCPARRRSRRRGTRPRARRAASAARCRSAPRDAAPRRATGTSSSRARRTGRRPSVRPPRCGRVDASGSAPSLDSSTTASSARRRARSRFAGGSRSTSPRTSSPVRRRRRRASAGRNGRPVRVEHARARPSARSTRRSARSIERLVDRRRRRPRAPAARRMS